MEKITEEQESEENISVCIRIRPLNDREKKNKDAHVLRCLPRLNALSITDRSGQPLPGANHVFQYDQIFPPHVTTRDIYTAVGRPIVESTLRGINGTIFAYGQTSSGKTYTMQGVNDESQGILPLSVEHIFDYIQDRSDRDFLIRVSYVEIYNEIIRDLLCQDEGHQNLKIREDPSRGIYIECQEEMITDFDSIMTLLHLGEKRRHVGMTAMNEQSSRSHSIFRLVIESKEKELETKEDLDGGGVLVATLNLVDLAGSESSRHTGAEGQRQREAGNINRSLLTLSRVINALASNQQGTNAPFRDSRLTRLLQNSLAGNTRTCIICCATPSDRHLEETKSTLQFAARAKAIKTSVAVNEVLDDQAQLKRLRAELRLLKAKRKEQDDPRVPQLEAEKEALELERALQAAKISKLTSLILNNSGNSETRHEEEHSHELSEDAHEVKNCGSPFVMRNHKKKKRHRETWAPGNHDESELPEKGHPFFLNQAFYKSPNPSLMKKHQRASSEDGFTESELIKPHQLSFLGSSHTTDIEHVKEENELLRHQLKELEETLLNTENPNDIMAEQPMSKDETILKLQCALEQWHMQWEDHDDEMKWKEKYESKQCEVDELMIALRETTECKDKYDELVTYLDEKSKAAETKVCSLWDEMGQLKDQLVQSHFQGVLNDLVERKLKEELNQHELASVQWTQLSEEMATQMETYESNLASHQEMKLNFEREMNSILVTCEQDKKEFESELRLNHENQKQEFENELKLNYEDQKQEFENELAKTLEQLNCVRNDHEELLAQQELYESENLTQLEALSQLKGEINDLSERLENESNVKVEAQSLRDELERLQVAFIEQSKVHQDEMNGQQQLHELEQQSLKELNMEMEMKFQNELDELKQQQSVQLEQQLTKCYELQQEVERLKNLKELNMENEMKFQNEMEEMKNQQSVELEQQLTKYNALQLELQQTAQHGSTEVEAIQENLNIQMNKVNALTSALDRQSNDFENEMNAMKVEFHEIVEGLQLELDERKNHQLELITDHEQLNVQNERTLEQLTKALGQAKAELAMVDHDRQEKTQLFEQELKKQLDQATETHRLEWESWKRESQTQAETFAREKQIIQIQMADEKSAEIQYLTSECERLSVELEKNQPSIESEQKVEALRHELVQVRANAESLNYASTRKLEQLTDVNARQTARLKKLEAVKMTKAIQEKFAQLQKENQELTSQMAQHLQHPPPQVQLTLTHLTQDLARTQTAKAELEDEVQCLREKLAEEKKTTLEIVPQLEHELEDRSVRNQACERKLAVLQQDLDSAQDQIRYLEKENLELHGTSFVHEKTDPPICIENQCAKEKENIQFPTAPMSSEKPPVMNSKPVSRKSLDEVTPDCKQQ